MAPKVQHLGARGQHPGPPAGPGLRGEPGEDPSSGLPEERSPTAEAGPAEHLRHGPAQRPQGEAVAAPAPLAHPRHEHRRGAGRAGRHVPPAPLEEEPAEGTQRGPGEALPPHPLSPGPEEVRGGGLGCHQRRRNAGRPERPRPCVRRSVNLRPSALGQAGGRGGEDGGRRRDVDPQLAHGDAGNGTRADAGASPGRRRGPRERSRVGLRVPEQGRLGHRVRVRLRRDAGRARPRLRGGGQRDAGSGGGERAPLTGAGKVPWQGGHHQGDHQRADGDFQRGGHGGGLLQGPLSDAGGAAPFVPHDHHRRGHCLSIQREWTFSNCGFL